jgi:POT family proton-dependent oligopeptide transporter
LAFLVPGVLYFLMPIVLALITKRLYKAPPQGSVVVETMRVFKHLLKDGGWGRLWKGGDDFWNRAKPSYMIERDGGVDESKVFWDDKFVDEIKQSLHACAVFMLIPVFSLSSGGIGNSLNSMSAAMILDGVPNDLISK